MRFSCPECESSERFFIHIPPEAEGRKGCYISCVICGYVENLAKFLIMFGFATDIDAIRQALSEE